MDNTRILWVDDEIDLLKPHIIFLEKKGYKLDTATNGRDALDMIQDAHYDVIFLDENMPGLSGLDTLVQIKRRNRNTPVVMVTKSEEERIMEEAIGSQIADYLIKPVNPNQLLLSIKKLTEQKKLINEKTATDYQTTFRQLAINMSMASCFEDWVDIYKELIRWDLSLDHLENATFRELLETQKKEANALFFKFISKNYKEWLKGSDIAPTLSPQIFPRELFPLLKDGKKVFAIVIDNLRYDQWKIIESELTSLFITSQETIYSSILPTATQYARNAMFAGLMPSEIKRRYPDKWFDDDDDETKNQFEEFFMRENLKRYGLSSLKCNYAKISQLTFARKFVENLKSLADNDLNVIVYNFVDILSHAKTEMDVIKELADNDKAYRSLTRTWFLHSPLFEILKFCSERNIIVHLTTDHGTINVQNPVKIIGERELTTNLRYKAGRNMSYNPKEVHEVKNPEEYHLPKMGVNTAFVFAGKDDFFAYPNNFNHYVRYYRNTYQHGGISLEEMLIPSVLLLPK
ncbi:MAG: response regulator [Thermaurantimonas sp.]